MNAPTRREQPKRHLDASLVPLENALLERAERIRPLVETASNSESLISFLIRNAVADALGSLAEELHYW